MAAAPSRFQKLTEFIQFIFQPLLCSVWPNAAVVIKNYVMLGGVIVLDYVIRDIGW